MTEPLSEMSEAAPDDLFAGRLRRPGGGPGPVRAADHGGTGHGGTEHGRARHGGTDYDGDDDLYGAAAAVGPGPEADDEPESDDRR
ncbi:hypothetical protein [Kitasatospora sp. NPDC093806]|uniref:hypothetical protein n=1 Tax=Kitasatospora sp. NPDC093806 TaxID=3155075 RepID=UPI0034158A21